MDFFLFEPIHSYSFPWAHGKQKGRAGFTSKGQEGQVRIEAIGQQLLLTCKLLMRGIT